MEVTLHDFQVWIKQAFQLPRLVSLNALLGYALAERTHQPCWQVQTTVLLADSPVCAVSDSQHQLPAMRVNVLAQLAQGSLQVNKAQPASHHNCLGWMIPKFLTYNTEQNTSIVLSLLG